jgi:hypothetical protein
VPPLRPNTTTRSQGVPMDDDLEAGIVLAYVSSDGGTTWEPQGAGVAVADQKVHDDYQSGEILDDQTGASGVLTFTFASAVHLVVVDANGAATDIARADPFGGTPTGTRGIPCRDEVPTFMPVIATVVKVWAPTNMVVSCYGYRRA